MKRILVRKQTWWIFLVIWALNVNAYAQVDWQQMRAFYQQAQFDRLKTALQNVKGAQTNQPEYLFFKSLFIKDAEQAVKNYQHIFETSKGWLKSLAAERLRDYFYARGFYYKAAEYEPYIQKKTQNPVQQKPAPVVTPDTQTYFIQVGAFSTQQNAQKQSDFLERHGIKSKIVVRHINNRNYYCVWVKGSTTLADTEKIAKQIKTQLNIDYRIIKE